VNETTDHATDEPTEAPESYGRLRIAASVGMVLFAACIVVPSICLKTLGADFDLSFGDKGLLGSARMATLVVALLIMGYFADRVGKRGFLAWGLVLLGAGMAATALAGGYATLLIAQAIVGIGAGAMEALINPLVAELNPRNTARHLNVVNGLFSIGLVVAALLTGELLEGGHSWRLPFWLWVLPALGAAWLFAARRYPPIPQAHEQGGRWRAFIRDPLFWMLMVAMVLGGGCEAGMTFWGSNFVEAELDASPRSGAWTVALYGLFMAIGRFSSGALVSRITPLRLMVGSAVGCGIATLGFSWVQGIGAAWTLFALGGLFVACFWPTLLAVGSDHIAKGSATLFALLAAAGISGCVILPWGIGEVADAAGELGLRIGVLLIPASMVAMVVVLLMVGATIRSRAAAEATLD